MSTTQIVLIIVVVVVVIAAAAAGWVAMRRRNLRQRFGPEYDRLVAERDDRSAAEKELRDRERRHAELDLRALPAESRQRYLAEWEEVQVRFLDAPDEAVRTGDDLVTRLVAERGYPTEDFEEQLADLSVKHAYTLNQYRDAHDIAERNARGEATTEQLRQALVHYRAIFAELVGDPAAGKPADSTPADGRSADGRSADGTPAGENSADEEPTARQETPSGKETSGKENRDALRQ